MFVQVIHLNCGGMVLHSAISHCVCDGIGTAQFLRAWAQLTAHPNSDPCVVPFHTRDMLKPREPPRITFSHPEYKILRRNEPFFERTRFLDPLPLAPISVTFTSSEILRLKQFHDSSPKCTSFEALASHVWRAWVKSKDMPPDNRVKLLFTVDARRKLSPNLPSGFYGNGFVTACAETSAGQLVMSDVHHGVQLIRQAKEGICDGYVRSAIDMLESKRAAPDCSSGFVISQWSKLGLEDLDFGEGRPVYMGPPFPTSYVYCLFLPVIGDLHAVRVWMSVHQSIADKFERALKVFPALPLNHVPLVA